MSLTSSPHLDLIVLDYPATGLFEALIQIFLGYDYTDSWSEGLNFETAIPDLSEELLGKANFVKGV